MLVIRCREGESVAIGDDIEVTILAAGAGKVKLGFKAPISVLVARRCMELTRRQNHAAVHGTDGSLVESLASYLNGAELHSLTCVVPLQPVSELSEEHKENLKFAIERKLGAEKYRDDSIVKSLPGQEA